MSTLIIYLPYGSSDHLNLNATSTEWLYAITDDGQRLRQHGSAPVNLLPEPRRSQDVIAVVPIQALSWQRVTLPRNANKNLKNNQAQEKNRALLDGLLEEVLLDEPARLHLALGPDEGENKPRWVAICDLAWLTLALQILEAANRRVTRIVPELSPPMDAQAVPVLRAMGMMSQAEWVLTGLSPNAPVLRWPLPLIESSPSTVLPSDLTADPANDPPWLHELPENTVLYAEPSVLRLAEHTINVSIPLETGPERWLAAAQSPWELAQHHFANSRRSHFRHQLNQTWQSLKHAPQWKPARLGLLILLLTQLLGLNLWAFNEKSAIQQRQAAIKRIMNQTFPKVLVIADAPLQMAREVASLRQMAGLPSASDLEVLLAAVAQALPAGRVPTGVDFNLGELRLRGLDLRDDELSHIQTTLSAQSQNPIQARLENGILILQSRTP